MGNETFYGEGLRKGRKHSAANEGKENSYRLPTLLVCYLGRVSKHRDFIVCPSSKISSTTKPKLQLKSL